MPNQMNESILIISAIPKDRLSLCYIFYTHFQTFEATDGEEALAILHNQNIDLVIIDLCIPTSNGLHLIKEMHLNPDYMTIPVIFISQLNDFTKDLNAFCFGANDYITPPYESDSVLFRVNSLLKKAAAEKKLTLDNESLPGLGESKEYCSLLDLLKTEESQWRQSLYELRYRADHDNLTQIYNKEAFYKKTADLLNEHPTTEFVLVRFNIARFKIINELFGKESGDSLLVIIANRLKEKMYGDSTYARFEADHFVACYPTINFNLHDLLHNIKEITDSSDIPQRPNINFGIYIIKDRTIGVEQMCDRANMALQTIRNNYSKQYAFYDDQLRQEMIRESEFCAQLQSALEQRQFEIYFQPIHNLSKDAPASAEVLVRWNHPEKGMLSPGLFIPLFERTGLIASLDYYVWDMTCQYLANRKEQNLPEIPVSVNISRISLYNPDLCNIIVGLTEKYGINPAMFKLEITESAYSDNPKQLLDTVTRLQNLGFLVLMDDFGSGYSSFNTLKDIPVDILKVDMKFLSGFETGGRVGTILTSIFRMAQWLNLPVIAEGVETKEQLDFLKSIGCNLIQGYYFAKPMPEHEFSAYITSNRPVPARKSLLSTFTANDFDLIMGGNMLVSTIVESMFGGFGLYEQRDKRVELLRVNTGYYKIIGYTPETLTKDSHNILNHIYEQDKRSVLEALRNSTENNEPVRIVFRRYHTDGHLMYLDTIINHIGGQENRPLYCMSFNDVTDLIESAEHLQTILENVGSGIVMYELGDTLQITYANPEFYQSNGYEADEIQNAMSFVHPDDICGLWEKFENKKSGNRFTYDYRTIRKNQSIQWIHLTATRLQTSVGENPLFLGVLTDVTELQEAHRKLEFIMDNMDANVCICEVGKEPVLTFANNRFYSQLGFTKQEYDNDNIPISGHIHPEDVYLFLDGVMTCVTDQTTMRIQFRIQKRNKRYLYITSTITPLEKGDGGVPRVLLLSTDTALPED